jgi:hypothetical protein
MRAVALAAIAVAALVTALAVPPAFGQSDLPNTGGAFEDDNGDYHEAAINAIAAEGITEGCAKDLYCPAHSVTRAQMASFLARAYGLGTRGGRVFDDVTPGSTHAGAIAAIAADGITQGCTTTLYCPEDPVTRAQMASFMARALDLKLIYPTISLSGRFRGGCNPDRTRCTGTEHFPAGRTYEVREGIVHDRPFLSGERSVFESGATSFSLTVDGETKDPKGRFSSTAGGKAKKVFVFRFSSMRPGTYQLVGRWRWNGVIVQTTVLTVVVD